jgi:hypothetical protein
LSLKEVLIRAAGRARKEFCRTFRAMHNLNITYIQTYRLPTDADDLNPESSVTPAPAPAAARLDRFILRKHLAAIPTLFIPSPSSVLVELALPVLPRLLRDKTSPA